ncbi:LysR family transcriptional regulator [Nesterenkonia aurantiaca]|uniref:DNA-binding transcriptional LysR family regulator n=1 Tax=Nesterenkonia aurantiaca TaxID=1436010 RepID=A0A4R7G6B0_9MICC|nr:LysR family transcriptional regulator [Nesterenkonia aurantiaca]TDS86969.1 DNA-binding transcriptional LysR family regulator [Nesterenkonia aurantiaca]
MNHRLLRYFAAVADEGTVSAAAETLHITQPALSRQIRELEKNLGLQLFRRGGNRLILTSEGAEFLSVSREVLRVHSHAEMIAETLASGTMRNLTIGAPQTTLIDIVAPFVATFSQNDPTPHVSEIALSPEITKDSSDHDLIITPQRAANDHASLLLATLPIWACVPRSHEWASRDSIDLGSLCEQALILVPTMQKSRQMLDAALNLANLAPRNTIEVSQGRLAQALAAAGRGVAVLSDDTHFALHPLRILDERGQALRFHLYAAWRRDHHGSAMLLNMAQRLRDFCQLRYGRSTAPAPEDDTLEDMSTDTC